MRNFATAVIFLLGVCSMVVYSQDAPNSDRHSLSLSAVDFAFTYVPERAKTSNVDCGCFWFQGGSAEVALESPFGLSLVSSFTGQHATALSGGGDVGKLSYLFGPRFMKRLPWGTSKHESLIFGEALFGGVHGFDGIFPNGSATASTANSFGFQSGGGWEVALAHNVFLRPAQVDYFRSNLPNAGSQSQNDLRLAFGVSYRIQRQ